MDALTRACLKSPDLMGCIGFKPEMISPQGSPKAACVSSVLNYLGLQNNQYSVGMALGNILPDRGEFIGVWIYGRRKNARVACTRNIPARGFQTWACRARPVIYTDHHQQGTWRVSVGYEPLLDAILFYNPANPSLWEAVASKRHDEQHGVSDIAISFHMAKNRSVNKYPDDWLPKLQRTDLWHAPDWSHQYEYAAEQMRRTHAA